MTCTSGNGTKAKPQVMAHIHTLVEQFMMAFGSMICNMEKVPKDGLMEPAIKANITKDKNMAKESSYGQVKVNTKVNSKIMISTEQAFTCGPICANTLENGSRILSMEQEFLRGKMVVPTRDNIKMIKSTDLAYLLGLTEDVMKVIGSVENSMVKENIWMHTEKQDKGIGKMEKLSNGLHETVSVL